MTAPASRDYTLTLPQLSTAAEGAMVRVRLQGVTDDADADPDHQTKLSLNGIEIDQQVWNGQIPYDQVVAVPHAWLLAGDNTLTVAGVGGTGAAADQVFVNWIEVDYWGTYVAEDDALRFGAPAAGPFHFQVSGFRAPEVVVLDVTDPTQVVLMTHTTVVAEGSILTLHFEDTAQPGTLYLALTWGQLKPPASLERDQPSAWKSPGNGADYLMITHEAFYPSAVRLSEHRQASGLRVATVNVGDLYDEFTHGIFQPQAIRDFIAYAYHHWVPPAPTYVLLVGDASLDYKDNRQTGTVTYVPSRIIETEFWGEAPSDNWFVAVSGEDLLPDLLIGRLPAQTVAEAEAMVDKILQYEQTPPDDSWNKNVLLVADDAEESWELIFEQTAEDLASLLPQGYTAHKVYAGHYPPGNPTTDIAHYINRGSLLVNYTGHGDVSGWGLSNAGGPLFDLDDVTALANTHKLPVVAIANCLSGFFTGPTERPSMAEVFLRLPDTGAVAVWAPASLGFTSEHRLLMVELYKAIFQGGQSGLGAASTTAKLAAYGQDSALAELVATYVLFGDPATRLSMPSALTAQKTFR